MCGSVCVSVYVCMCVGVGVKCLLMCGDTRMCVCVFIYLTGTMHCSLEVPELTISSFTSVPGV